MVGMKVRTYYYYDLVEKSERGQLPGTSLEKWNSFIQTCEAVRLLDDLGIEFKLNFPLLVFKMTDEQYALWRIAAGERWFNPSHIDEHDFDKELPGWEKYIDTYVNYRKDHHIISSNDGMIRYIDVNTLVSRTSVKYQDSKIAMLNDILPKEMRLK